MEQIPKEDLDYLLKKTSITAKEIKHWYRIYMVSACSYKLIIPLYFVVLV